MWTDPADLPPIASLPERPEPSTVLMCEPLHFDVVDVRNDFMSSGLGRVDRARARSQWIALVSAFESLGATVLTLPPVPGLVDQVFTANPTLPALDAHGQPVVVLAHMRHPERQAEVDAHAAWFASRGYRILRISASPFEGQGDGLWHPGRRLLWGGVGPRTCVEAWEQVSRLIEVPVVPLVLEPGAFYHLDTALCLVDERTALIHRPAFTGPALRLLEVGFENLIDVDETEARDAFACNAHAICGTVVLQQGAPRTVSALRALGHRVLEVETGEFVKSGGSVFCMKLMVY